MSESCVVSLCRSRDSSESLPFRTIPLKDLSWVCPTAAGATWSHVSGVRSGVHVFLVHSCVTKIAMIFLFLGGPLANWGMNLGMVLFSHTYTWDRALESRLPAATNSPEIILNTCLLDGFLSTWHILESFGKREPKLRSPYKISLSTSLWSIYLVDVSCGRTQITVYNATPVMMVLGSVR